MPLAHWDEHEGRVPPRRAQPGRARRRERPGRGQHPAAAAPRRASASCRRTGRSSSSAAPRSAPTTRRAILLQNGFKARNLSGGMLSRAMLAEAAAQPHAAARTSNDQSLEGEQSCQQHTRCRDELHGARQGRQRTGRPAEGAVHEHAPGDRQRADPDHGGGLRGHRRLPADHPPGQVLRRADRAQEAVHRREPHRRQHGEHRQRRLHVSGMERGVDEGGEDRREVEDPGRPQGEPVGARVLGQVGAAAAGRRDLHQEVRLRSGPGLQGGAHRGVHVLAGRRRQPELSPGLPARASPA